MVLGMRVWLPLCGKQEYCFPKAQVTHAHMLMKTYTSPFYTATFLLVTSSSRNRKSSVNRPGVVVMSAGLRSQLGFDSGLRAGAAAAVRGAY